jgi:hypothetical protein
MTNSDKTRELTGCYGKKPYSSRSAAKNALWAARRKAPKLAFVIYKCQTCGKWHLGHDRRFRNAKQVWNKKPMRRHQKLRR